MHMLADMSTTMKALNAGLSIEGITLYLFWVSTVAMGTGALYFFLMKGSASRAYQSVYVVAGLICAVAAFHYYRMSGIYVEGVASLFDAEGNRIEGATISAFPTAYRYIDWLITTPLLLMEFPLLLNLGAKAKGLFYKLVILDVLMLVFAWIAEESVLGSASWWINYVISCVFWLLIVATLYGQVSKAIDEAPGPIAASARTMRLFILVGWVIYPIGFLMALAGDAGGSYREILYNVADVINKVGFGLVCFAGAQGLAEMDAGTKEL
jgi:bacteriorhodopsin